MKRTLKRESKGLEIAEREAVGSSTMRGVLFSRVRISLFRGISTAGRYGGPAPAGAPPLKPVAC
jgi:hypothetical protein